MKLSLSAIFSVTTLFAAMDEILLRGYRWKVFQELIKRLCSKNLTLKLENWSYLNNIFGWINLRFISESQFQKQS